MLALEPLHAPITESYSVHDVSNKQTQITAAPRTPRAYRNFVRERKDPAKMAHSRMALSKRGLGAKPASSKSDAGARRAGCRYRCRSAHHQQ